ncbi:Membrane-associated phospholipid phosphatase [Marinobacterium lacunae]|uniref:Membrane-associated phospholipid phosphatase n=1 Tax=Marinobacterium lacunae TaxID=1232683 RepID=A0A081FY80_9GAMM|nr:phosphatase PAP2 family protein [Marinobacterium lacunae]KEA63485.1 Membrane-associated phospholipid phosphatase [Marinobacterium lacunae]
MITPRPLFSTRWHWSGLIAGHVAALLLLLSYVLPAGHAAWQSMGATLFYALNGTLAGNGAWTWFWAWMNSREVDAATGVLLLLFLTFPLVLPRERLQAALCGFISLMILMLPARELLSEITQAYGLSGQSPSLVLEPAYRFSELRPDIPAKDSASTSFPGDHASVLLIWFGFLAFNARRWLKVSVLAAVTLWLVLPRLIGGAHWLADVAVGGMVMALITLSWAFASPVAEWINRGLLKLAGPLFRLAGRIPLLGRLPFFCRQD